MTLWGTMLRKSGLVAVAVAAVLYPMPTAVADSAAGGELHAVVVAGGKPRGVVEGQQWGAYARLRDASGKRVGDASLACHVDKAKKERVIADCTHTVRIDGVGSLLFSGVHHYRDQTVLPGTADPMRLTIIGGSGAFAGASGRVDATEANGGYVYQIPPTG
ncbi:hypothetical protein [Yinghuangia soli]|uniref:Dirigent-like protein n=1 Tax=Yinghuangia soli TaxID=2908204 RepID=A0AA41U6L0_9ACTN|nr:hypothetical protein [Yinghuangia soli]MCF2531059.1 hypothetical protein [Yinghuangia soli]